jgi:UDP-N-acetyl-D-mannosaminuronic acid dehydrogenase
MNLTQLQQKIEDKTARLAVIGLGYVGLPVACTFADAGFDVIGVDVKQERVSQINAGVCPIEGEEPGLAELLDRVTANGRLQATTDYDQLRDRDVILIDVETPVNEEHLPEYQALKAVCRSLGPVLKKRALVIVESTLAPGTMDRTVRPLLEEATGRRSGVDFFLGACPERVMPGKLLANLYAMSRVCGGETPQTAETMIALYRHIVEADLDPADCITAELVKTAENAYRDVNIAFANEVALVCEAVGGDVWRVRELVNKSPGRHMLLPGAGVGGHCIPKDPWLLVAQARQMDVPVRLIPASRAVNDYMPVHIASLLQETLLAMGRPLRGARIGVLGYAYLENADDARNSPSIALVKQLRDAGASVVIHDPWIAEHNGSVLDRLQGCDAAVLMVAHTVYKALNLTALREALCMPVLIDGRHLYSYGQAEAAGLVYRVIGQGTQRNGHA